MDFEEDLYNNLQKQSIMNYDNFEETFMDVLNRHAPLKKKVVRSNHKPYMTKTVRKAIMTRTALERKFWQEKTVESETRFKKHKNYTKKLIKKEKKKYFTNLDLTNFTDNKKFWRTVKPLFSDGFSGQNITLVEKDIIISDDQAIAERFNSFFVNSVKSLEILENKILLMPSEHIENDISKAIHKFENHPSIIEIKKNVFVNDYFEFLKINEHDVKLEIKSLKPNKASTFMSIPTKQLKRVVNIVSKPLSTIWNNEIIENQKFPTKLKNADITPIHEKLETIFPENYRPVSILPVVSKIFERLMQKQMKNHIEKYLSPFLCGYRKGFNAQYALVAMIEKWKESSEEKGFSGAILTDLSKAFDTINHELLIAKLAAYGFNKQSLTILWNYLTSRFQRTRIHFSFSTWEELLSGVPQGSVLGPLLFNIYLNDIFFVISRTYVCNFADDTTLTSSSEQIKDIFHDLNHDIRSAILWFEDNYMKLNEDKCKLFVSGNLHEHHFINLGDELIWESSFIKLLGITIDKSLNFDLHLRNICTKANRKVTALARVVKFLPFHKRKLLLNTFIESQFSYCPLVWMFCSRKLNAKINRLHERALRLAYDDYTSSFKELLENDKSLSIHHRNIHLLAIEMFKVKKGLSPSIIQDLFQENPFRENTFIRPNLRYEKGKKSIRIFGPIIWNNMLPDSIKECNSLIDFKSSIKSWIPNNCVCKLCKTYIQRLGYINVI